MLDALPRVEDADGLAPHVPRFKQRSSASFRVWLHMAVSPGPTIFLRVGKTLRSMKAGRCVLSIVAKVGLSITRNGMR